MSLLRPSAELLPLVRSSRIFRNNGAEDSIGGLLYVFEALRREFGISCVQANVVGAARPTTVESTSFFEDSGRVRKFLPRRGLLAIARLRGQPCSVTAKFAPLSIKTKQVSTLVSVCHPCRKIWARNRTLSYVARGKRTPQD